MNIYKIIGICVSVCLSAFCLAEAAPVRVLPPEGIEKIQAAMPGSPPATPVRPRRILVYSEASAFFHGSIPWAQKALEIMGEKTGAFTAVVSDDPGNFLPERLKEFDAVVLNNTTGELLVPAKPKPPAKPARQHFKTDEDFQTAEADWKAKQAEFDRRMESFVPPPDRSNELRGSLMDWLKSGKGLVGIHAATDCSYDWPEYGEMIGGWFSNHPWSEEVAIKNDDPSNPINAVFGGEGFRINDEIYQFLRGDVYSRNNQRVLLSLDMSLTPDKGSRPDKDYAISWIKHHGAGRVFYCSLGHRPEIFSDPRILAHYLAGIQWAIGDLKGVETAPNPLP